jgi:hypothetical protein
MRWKTSVGLTEPFLFANGQPGAIPFVDTRTKEKMIAMLSANPATPPVSVAPAPVVAPVTPVTPPASLTPEEAQIAQAGNLLPTANNIAAFQAAAMLLELDTAVVGPGVNDSRETVLELQQVLNQLGYTVFATGVFDQGTTDAVLKLKRAHGLLEVYQLADGSPGVHPFIDARTKATLIKLLGH